MRAVVGGAAQTPAEKWAVIEKAWVLYCQRGADTFDWDYDSRDVMATLTGHFAFEGLSELDHVFGGF